MCLGVRGIFCCFNEVVAKLLPGYEVFYDEHGDKDDDDNDWDDDDDHNDYDDGCSSGSHGTSNVFNVLFDLFQAERYENILSSKYLKTCKAFILWGVSMSELLLDTFTA